MDNNIHTFHNSEFGTLDILMIDGEPYFPAAGCAKLLGYSNPHKAVSDHCPHLTKREIGVKSGVKADGSPAYQRVSVNFIPEGDLYRLIIRSKLPAANRFSAWVYDSVLPGIRKHGLFVTDDILEQMLKNPDFGIRILKELKAEKEKNNVLQSRIDELAPKAGYYDVILRTANAVPISLIARDYGMSAVKLNKVLHALRIQYKIGGTWILYQEYANKGYTKSQTFRINENKSVIHTYFTQAGRLFLYEILKRNGILPLMEFKCFDDGPDTA